MYAMLLIISGLSCQIAVEQNENDNSKAPFSVIGIIVVWIMLHMLSTLAGYYSRFMYFFQKLHTIFRLACAAFGKIFLKFNAKASSSDRFNPLDRCRGEYANDLKISRVEVEELMERLQISYDPFGDKLQDALGSKEIGALFEEEEPSLEEIKEAFGVFDENCDGYIDAAELQNALSSFGFPQLSEVDCRRLIANFDGNGDGLIDFAEFAKIIEKSFQ